MTQSCFSWLPPMSASCPVMSSQLTILDWRMPLCTSILIAQKARITPVSIWAFCFFKNLIVEDFLHRNKALHKQYIRNTNDIMFSICHMRHHNKVTGMTCLYAKNSPEKCPKVYCGVLLSKRLLSLKQHSWRMNLWWHVTAVVNKDGALTQGNEPKFLRLTANTWPGRRRLCGRWRLPLQ